MTFPRCDSVAALYALQNSMMLTPCWPSAGPTGGAGLACPAWIWSLINPTTFFFGAMLWFFLLSMGPADIRARKLNLGDLRERQLDRRLATEDRHQHLELLLLGVDLADRGRQRRERAVHDGDGFAHLEVDQDLGTLQRRLGGRRGTCSALGGLLGSGRRQQELHHVVQRQRGRLGRRTDEAGDTRGVTHRAPRLVVELHAHQDVARQHLAVDLLALAVLD